MTNPSRTSLTNRLCFFFPPWPSHYPPITLLREMPPALAVIALHVGFPPLSSYSHGRPVCWSTWFPLVIFLFFLPLFLLFFLFFLFFTFWTSFLYFSDILNENCSSLKPRAIPAPSSISIWRIFWISQASATTSTSSFTQLSLMTVFWLTAAASPPAVCTVVV